MYACAHLFVCVDACGDHKSMLNPLELELLVVVICQKWVLRIELNSSARLLCVFGN